MIGNYFAALSWDVSPLWPRVCNMTVRTDQSLPDRHVTLGFKPMSSKQEWCSGIPQFWFSCQPKLRYRAATISHYLPIWFESGWKTRCCISTGSFSGAYWSAKQQALRIQLYYTCIRLQARAYSFVLQEATNPRVSDRETIMQQMKIDLV